MSEPPGQGTPSPVELTANLARQLLESDVANIVALVTAGQPLTKGQRAILEEYAKRKPAQSPPPALAPVAPPAPAPQAPAEPFTLIPDLPAPMKLEDFPDPGDYQHTQKVYAERYGVSVRTIKLWIAEGKECDPPKPCPLDNPEALLAWWHTVKTNRPDARLLALADAARRARVGQGDTSTQPQGGAGAGNSSGTSNPPPQTQSPPPPPPVDESLDIGFAASLQRVRIAEAQAHRRYLEELNKSADVREEAKLSRLQKAWQDLSEQLRFLEKAAPDVLAKSGEMVHLTDLQKILARLHGPIVSGLRSLLNRVEAKTGPQATLEAARPAFKAEVERLLATLLSSKFAPPQSDTAAA